MSQRKNTSIPPEILASVRRIEIKTRRLVEEVFSGEYWAKVMGRFYYSDLLIYSLSLLF